MLLPIIASITLLVILIAVAKIKKIALTKCIWAFHVVILSFAVFPFFLLSFSAPKNIIETISLKDALYRADKLEGRFPPKMSYYIPHYIVEMHDFLHKIGIRISHNAAIVLNGLILPVMFFVPSLLYVLSIIKKKRGLLYISFGITAAYYIVLIIVFSIPGS